MARQISKDRNELPKQNFVNAVSHVLKFLRKEFFEVPFIHAHRKDYFDGILDRTDLWRIMSLNETYLQIEAKKKNILKLIQELAVFESEITKDELITTILDKSMGLDDVEDLQQYIQVWYINSASQHQSSQPRRRMFKRSPWRVMIEDAAKNRIGDFIKVLLFEISILIGFSCLTYVKINMLHRLSLNLRNTFQKMSHNCHYLPQLSI